MGAVVHLDDPKKVDPTVSTSSLKDHTPLSQEQTASMLALPARRQLFSYVHSAAVIVSLVCFVVAVATITPSWSLAWRLGFSGQIVIVGLLLSIMNICLQTVLPFLFLLVEARFGRSWPRTTTLF